VSTHLWLSSIARALLLPPFSLFILIAAGWLLSGWLPRAGRVMAGTGIVLLALLSTEFFANFLVLPLENMTAPLTSTSGTGAQAIVVLAAGQREDAPEYGGVDIPDTITLARLRYAARLQHETGLPILVSGGTADFDSAGKSKAAAMADALREDFRTPVKWIEGDSDNTAQNALFSANILRQDGVRRVLLVTDAMHMPRAQLVFARSGLEVVAAPTMFFGTKNINPMLFLPSAEGLRRSYYASYEWIGLLWYSALAPLSTHFITAR
jgi:uncharacterized SAM-binding protein YcdF (DUF218 family)